jgi:hypothetical protein
MDLRCMGDGSGRGAGRGGVVMCRGLDGCQGGLVRRTDLPKTKTGVRVPEAGAHDSLRSLSAWGKARSGGVAE